MEKGMPQCIAEHRLIAAGYMTLFDLGSHLFAFSPEGKHVASLSVVKGKTCPLAVQALEDKAKNVATCCT